MRPNTRYSPVGLQRFADFLLRHEPDDEDDEEDEDGHGIGYDEEDDDDVDDDEGYSE